MTITNNLYVKTLGDEDGVIAGTLHQDNIPVLEQNYVEKMNLNNGFTEQRLFRKIASIPDVANLKAYQDGYNLDDPKDLRRFLADNPEYMTVERLKSNTDSHILIK